MVVSTSAAARFASIGELLMILAQYVDDQSTLWSLCLANWRFNCVFTTKLSEHIVVRVEKDDEYEAVERLINCLVAGPYLPDLRHLQLIVNNGPAFPERVLEMVEKLLIYTPNLKIFTWESSDGDIPVSTLVKLSKHCRQLEELHLRSGLELNNYGTGFRDVVERPTFDNVRVFTSRGLGTWHALYILNQCRSLETVRMTHMGYMLALGWVHSGYHAHLRALVAREEAVRRSSSARPGPSGEPRQQHNAPLKMHMCYSRSAKTNHPCEVCESPDMGRYDPDDPRFHEVWPWAAGRARQFLENGQVRHITYEYPRPEPAEIPAVLAYDEVVKQE